MEIGRRNQLTALQELLIEEVSEVFVRSAGDLCNLNPYPIRRKMAIALSDILRITSTLLMLMFLTFCMGVTNLEAQVGDLANDEVEALLEVATQLGKKGWNRNMMLCNETVTVLPQKPDADNKVICNCSFPGGVCHVVAIYLKRQDLNGSLPIAIQKLPHLKQLDLWANYLSGNIPPEWAGTNLELLSLGVNRLTGKIPSYLGKITTLRSLNIENNMFSGTVPSELGDLVNLENLTLSANYLSGELPSALANLTGLKALRLSRNNFTGRIPEFIQSWKHLDALEIQAGGFTGPIPSNISLLTNLTDLRISNLLGNGSEIPNLDPIAGIKMLSNCNLSGNFPKYLTVKAKLKILDLSFNRLNGPLPTSTLLGTILRGPSQIGSTQEILAKRYSVHINCGGPVATIGKTTYEADDDLGGAAKYASTGRDWKKSTTGHFWDVNSSSASYIAQNRSILGMDNSVLYTNASLTPLSLTYYIPCLVNGNYNVKLHFAEIVIRDNRSYYSLGRRVFDVYIQNIVVLKDFDIVTKARGVDKVYIHNCTALVTNGALEIRLHWAGKGNTMSPEKGTYGPLISAIDVESELVGLDLVTGIFTFRQIKAATNDFDAANKLGEGGFGCVYKGVLSDGTQIAVKQLSAKSKQGNREFVNEIGMISALQHPNLVRLYGCCIEGKQLLLVYEYMENNSLAHVLDKGNRGNEARLAYKAEDMGYMAPEYALYGYLTYKADVYSFGVVALEIVSGMNNAKFRRGENFVCLLDWALYLQNNGDIMEMVDPRLGSVFNKKEVVRMINVALLCTNQSPTLRPTMSTVVSMLEGKTDVEELVMVPSTLSDQSGYATALCNKKMAPALSDILRITSTLLMLMLLTFCMGAINLEGLANDEGSRRTVFICKILTASFSSNLSSVTMRVIGSCMEALLEVATQLGKKGWNRNMTLCNDEVVCHCSFPGGIDGSRYLKGQDLDGNLPKSIQKLPHLKQLDLWANYLSGNIPPEWADTKLEILSIGVNRLTGKIPNYLGKITTLRSLNIENNMFSGTIPPELGDLVNLENLTLSANYLSGELPSALANLTGLKALRISNLLGNGSEIPNLDSIRDITMLSNCNLSGNFPEYLTRKAQLRILQPINS
ncbi:hypothetical protein SADUNF_Sadunf19G0014500 [Salix dunnii]|uniref:non-specific serine/threonine protein kinase n=1 Tax=Salix dunnii TaxID=1413687 RepID=A0A835J173_9ROSI|nr:hypothetical protein SADUNF_Sadunf19G0014500 [Salix dunnii]